jgi:hypothetical protein
MPKISDSGQTACRPPAYIVRVIITILALTVGAPGVHTYAAEPEVAQAQDIQIDLEDAALAQFFDDFSRRVAKTCLEQNGPFITSLSTNNIACDMDALRWLWRPSAARTRRGN